MATIALDPAYAEKIDIRDREENFHGNQVVYIHWEDHLSFCAALAFPLPKDMPFAALTGEIIPGHYRAHPDCAAIDWERVEWTLDGEAFTPDPAATLAENGIGHKSLLRFTTPGLDGWRHSRS